MFAKSFPSKFEGSMVGAGFNVFAVWDYIINKTKWDLGVVELNPKLVGFILAGAQEDAEEQVQKAIDFLCAPDERSRSKDEGGARLVKEGEFQYRVVNWEKYQKVKNAADQREYNRMAQQKHRAKVREMTAAEKEEVKRIEVREFEASRKKVANAPISAPVLDDENPFNGERTW